MASIFGFVAVDHSATAAGAASLMHFRWWFLGPALLAESASMASFARQQRRFLQINGLHLAVRSMMAVTYAGNAISVSLPLAGSTLGSAYSYRAFRRLGAESGLASWALTVSGITSSVMFALILVAGGLLSGNHWAAVAAATTAALIAVPVATGLLAMRSARLRLVVIDAGDHLVRTIKRLMHRDVSSGDSVISDFVGQFSEVRMPTHAWLWVVWLSAWNWLADLLCLAACIAGLGASVPWTHLILAWGAGAGAASFGVTPGGVGVVEAALTAALEAAGLHAHIAVGAVLLYRLISFWAVLLVGWATYAVVQHRTDPSLSG